jgi:hypothetical protein
MVKKVRRSIFEVYIAVVVLALLVASARPVVAAPTSSTTSTTKSFDWKSMCAKIQPDLTWLPVCDLLTMITKEINARTAADTALGLQIQNIHLTPGPAGPTGPQGPAGTCNVKIVKGEATLGDIITPPNGFTMSDCDIIVRQKTEVAVHYKHDGKEVFLDRFIFTASKDSTSWTIWARATYTPYDGSDFYDIAQPAFYTVICAASTS